MWSFEENSKLGSIMRRDIAAGTYETERQNRQENGDYDFPTAINEYVHQCWLSMVAGHERCLTGPKAEVAQILRATPGMPIVRN